MSNMIIPPTPDDNASLRRTRTTVTFDGTAGGGATGTAVPVFTVTGEVLLERMVPYCTTNVGEAVAGATIALGVTGATTLFINATNSVDLDANEFWVDTAPDANGVALPAKLTTVLLTDNIIITPATQDTNAGVVEFTAFWRPISEDGLIS